MVSKNITVINPTGLHLKPAGVLSQTAMKYKCEIIIECGTRRAVAKSILNLMRAGIQKGEEIRLICDGIDEQEALEAVSKVIENGLGEILDQG